MRAPEFPQNRIWINTDPLTMRALLGKAILIDFWTYSCVNCIRTLPHLREWHRRYADEGLVIVGVHSPEFVFEKDEQNVRDAVKRLGITYPIVMDNDYAIWGAYANNVWPRKFLVNHKGEIVYDHAGEGAYGKTEEAIQRVLRAIDPDVDLPAVTSQTGGGGICYPATPETYLGSSRGRPGAPGEAGQWHTTGNWHIEDEYIEHAGKGGSLVMNFRAAEANLVMASEKQMDVEVQYEEKPLDTAMRGDDIDEREGRTYVRVHESRMYNIISTAHGEGEHKLLSGDLVFIAPSAGLRAYAFTFGGCT